MELNKKEITKKLFSILGLVLLASSIILVLNQAVWISGRFLDFGHGVKLFPGAITTGTSTEPLYLLFVATFISLMLTIYTMFKFAVFVINLDNNNPSKLWTALMAVAILINIFGGLYCNKDIFIGLLITGLGAGFMWLVDKYFKKRCPMAL